MTSPHLPFTSAARDAIADELYAAVCALCTDRERARLRAEQLLEQVERSLAGEKSEARP